MELKECPCCGGRADVIEKKVAPLVNKVSVQCTVCGMATPFLWNDKKVIDIWNRRASHAEISQVEYTDEQMGYNK